MDANPLLSLSTQPFAAPPFADIKVEHYRPAFDAGIGDQVAKVEAIAANPAPATFENTIEALEMSGFVLSDVASVFFNLVNTDADEAMEALHRDIAPVLARHSNVVFMNEALFRRVDDLHRRRELLGLTAEQKRVLERYHSQFVRSGAALDAAGKKRLAEITERLATLGTLFSQNVLADEKAYALVLDTEADLAGLPDFLRAAAAQAAADRGLPGKHVITLSRSSIEPFLQFSERRDLREIAFRAWTARGEGGGATDNRAIMAEMVGLRAERAQLLGHATFAHFKLDDSMAGTPEAASGLLRQVWGAAQRRVADEERELVRLMADDGANDRLEAWDWRLYAERLRKERYDFNESDIKPYLQLDKMIAAAFYTAERLFGLHFAELHDVPVYHPDVRVFEVSRGGEHVGLFYGDYFARSTKRSGAWMSAFRDQHKLAEQNPLAAGPDGTRPIILNVMNFAKPAPGEPALLSFDDARTLFHEFGHGLHGLLSDVTYPLIAGTNVARDFVEFPSQLFEHWLERPEILRKFAVHYRTGEPMPEAILQKLKAARTFNQGFQTIEYASSALVDMDLHSRTSAEGLDVVAAEADLLKSIGMPSSIVMRHRTPHFAHVFSGDGYAAGYYSYLWSEVLDADGFEAFVETGDVFDPATAKRLHDYVYSAGYLRSPAEAYQAFRGRMPTPDALLRKRGLTA